MSVIEYTDLEPGLSGQFAPATPDELPFTAVADPGESAACFGDLILSLPVWRAVHELGFHTPTPVQQEIVPLMIEGHDVVGQSQTGTGKTAAFGIPLAERLDPTLPVVQAIVLVPTRELAMQVAEELKRLTRYVGLRVAPIFGGESMKGQLHDLERGAQIVVGTPGRIMDHMRRRTLSLQSVRVAILDEADEMLDIGFADDMEYILRHTPRERQTALFSATMPNFVLRLIERYMRQPRWIHINPDQATVREIDQVYYEVLEADKPAFLARLLADAETYSRVVIFCRMQRTVDRVNEFLRRAGLPARGLHGRLSQNERTAVMRSFRDGTLRILVATNVAARGLDIRDVSHVFNFDMPDNLEEYIHRIGRTGRAGRRGCAVSLVSEWDIYALDELQARFGEALRRLDSDTPASTSATAAD